MRWRTAWHLSMTNGPGEDMGGCENLQVRLQGEWALPGSAHLPVESSLIMEEESRDFTVARASRCPSAACYRQWAVGCTYFLTQSKHPAKARLVVGLQRPCVSTPSAAAATMPQVQSGGAAQEWGSSLAPEQAGSPRKCRAPHPGVLAIHAQPASTRGSNRQTQVKTVCTEHLAYVFQKCGAALQPRKARNLQDRGEPRGRAVGCNGVARDRVRSPCAKKAVTDSLWKTTQGPGLDGTLPAVLGFLRTVLRNVH